MKQLVFHASFSKVVCSPLFHGFTFCDIASQAQYPESISWSYYTAQVRIPERQLTRRHTASRMLRHREVRTEFGLGPTRRQRRRDRKAERA